MDLVNVPFFHTKIHNTDCPLWKSPGGQSMFLKQLHFQGLVMEMGGGEPQKVSTSSHSVNIFNGNRYLFHLPVTHIFPNHFRPSRKIKNKTLALVWAQPEQRFPVSPLFPVSQGDRAADLM